MAHDNQRDRPRRRDDSRGEISERQTFHARYREKSMPHDTGHKSVEQNKSRKKERPKRLSDEKDVTKTGKPEEHL
ncbi:hypothetical protein CPC08DRAFT_532236 [Agrocybe pediades]|nr:hypothetical protein CPC08DRAFT_532236 [Agrocybe pediades]